MQTRTRLRFLDAGMASIGLSFVASCFGIEWLWALLIFMGLVLMLPMFIQGRRCGRHQDQ